MHKVIINLHIITIVFDLSWDDCNSQEKSETIVKQNLGVGGGVGGAG